MTREKAIKILKQIQRLYGGLFATSELKETYDAFDMAIEALSADRPSGEWVDEGYQMNCSVCGADFDYCDNDCHRFNYCPNCGAKMRGDK